MYIVGEGLIAEGGQGNRRARVLRGVTMAMLVIGLTVSVLHKHSPYSDHSTADAWKTNSIRQSICWSMLANIALCNLQ